MSLLKCFTKRHILGIIFVVKGSIMAIIDEKSMRKATIFELRDIARELGVPSPTTYKKEDLIEKVLKIVRGEEQPSTPKSRQGRPPKTSNDFYNTELGSFSLDGEQEDDNILDHLPKYTVLMESKNIVQDESFGFDTCKGYVYIQDKNMFVVDKDNPNENIVYIPSLMASEANLKEGDYLVGTCRKTSLGGILSEISNAQTYSSRDDFDHLSRTKSTKVINIAKIGSVSEGSRQVVKMSSLSDAVSLMEGCKASGYETIALNIDILPEEVSMMGDNFYTIYGQTSKRNAFMVKIFTNKIKRLVENKKKVIVFVNDLTKMVKHQNFLKGNCAFEVKENSLDTCISLLSLASSYSNGASVTIIALFKDSKLDSVQTLENELENMNCNFCTL